MIKKERKISSVIIFAPLFFVIFIGVFANLMLYKMEYDHFKEDLKTNKSFFLSITPRDENFKKIVHQHYKKTEKTFHNRLENSFLISLSVGFVFIILTYFFSIKIKNRLQEISLEVKRNQEKLLEQNKVLKAKLYLDELTNLPNRKAMEKALRKMQNPKLFIIDLDSFKDINDYYGNQYGDHVLKVVGKILQEFSQKKNIKLYRIGSDEFALLEDQNLDIERYEELILELVLLVKTMTIELPNIESELQIDGTVGFCLESDDVFAKAMIALNEAKKSQKDYVSYIKSMDTRDAYADQIRYAKIIKEALDFDRIVPHYQAIYNRDGESKKYECLARIKTKEGEFISPGFFMGTSKKVRLYSLMAKRLIEKSFKTISKTDKTISVNLLARDMMDSDVSNFVVDKIQEHGVAKQVVFEILEDESIEHLERIKVFIQRVKRMGVKIAIDDFGTGYSNFSYLLELKPDFIKIDGSLIKSIDTDANSRAIVKAILSFAKTLDIKTIAEFVHSKSVYDTCFALGIDEFQGFYLSVPDKNLQENNFIR